MATKLDEIFEYKKKELPETKKALPLELLLKKIEENPRKPLDVLSALRGKSGTTNVIAEIKRKTPFKGILKEIDPIEPRNLTGMAKLAHECELNFLSKHYNEKFNTVIVRIFRGYGIGSRDVISRWVRSLINKEPIEVYGEQSIFDYIYSKDTAEGLARIASSDYSGILNLGSGK